MTLSRGAWVKQDGVIGLTAVELRRVDAACYYQTTPGTARSGLLWVNSPTFQLVTAAANMSYDLQSVPGLVVGRSANEGAYTLTSQGVTNITTGAAPAAGLSRWDLIWLKQNDTEKADGDNLPVLGVTQGTAASSPTKPTASVPVGALVLAEAQIFSGTAGTNAAPNTLTQVWQYTALVGEPVPVRNTTERGTLSAPRVGDRCARLDLDASGRALEIWTGAAWIPAQRPVKHVTKDAALVGSSTGLAAKIASGEVQLIHQFGTGVVATDASGYINLTYAQAFPNGVISAQVNNGDSAQGRGDTYAVAGSPFTNSLTNLYISVTDASGTAKGSSTVRYMYDVWGW